MSETKSKRSFSPFLDCRVLSKQSDFDEYYLDVIHKEIYRKAGIDSDGHEYGVPEFVPIVKKKSIKDLLAEEAKSVGVESYLRNLNVQGFSLDDFSTSVDSNIQDFTDMPSDKLDGSLYGDKALEAFNSLDPALRGKHTTIEGFLNSLSQEKIETYIKGKVDAAFPKKEVVSGGE